MRNVRIDVLDTNIVQEFLLMQQMVRILLHPWSICPISRSLAFLSTSTHANSVEVEHPFHHPTLLRHGALAKRHERKRCGRVYHVPRVQSS
jgi:hypothetical protein